MRDTRLLLFVAACLVVVAPSAGRAGEPSKEEVRRRVEVLLSGYEHVPSASDWERAGPPAMVGEALVELARQDDARPSTRARAVSSMRHAPTPEVRQYLLATVRDAHAVPLLRRKAIQSLGAVEGDAALPVIRPLLLDPDPFNREAAIRGIAEVGTKAALEAVEAHDAHEASAVVRGTIVHVLPSLRASAASK